MLFCRWLGRLSLFVYIGSALAAPVIQRVRAFPDSVGRYDKVELRFDVEARFNNPFDPDEIDLLATFTSPGGKQWTIPGFYHYTYTLWCVRFSPNEIGTWQYQIRVTDRTGSMSTQPQSLRVFASKHHGPLRISAVNHRYLAFDDGTPYYGVGLWYNSGFSPFADPERDLDELKNLGVNFISTVMTPLETMASGVGRYDQEICRQVDELLGWCEKRDLLLSLNLWFHSFLSETVWPGPNRRWHTNPYQNVCSAKDFYSSPEAWRYQEKLYRYIIARWSFSRSLGIWFIVDEVNGTDGWMSGDSLGAAKWGKKVHDYFKAHDPYQHLTTGTRSGGIKEWWHEGYQIFDLAAREIYEAQGFPILTDGRIDPDDPHPLKLSYDNYISQIRQLWQGYGKPAIIGETGWDHTFYEPSMPGYLAQYHNVLWAGLSSGLAMTPFWWAHSRFINDNVVTQQLTSLARFADQIPFARLTGLAPVEIKISHGDAFAIKSDQLIFGWAVNPLADVTGATIRVFSLPQGEYSVQIYHTWRGQVIDEKIIVCQDGVLKFTVPILKIEDSHAQYVGQDVAFMVKPVKR